MTQFLTIVVTDEISGLISCVQTIRVNILVFMVQFLTGKCALHFNHEFPFPQCWANSLEGKNKIPSFTYSLPGIVLHGKLELDYLKFKVSNGIKSVSFESPSGMFACGTLG